MMFSSIFLGSATVIFIVELSLLPALFTFDFDAFSCDIFVLYRTIPTHLTPKIYFTAIACITERGLSFF